MIDFLIALSMFVVRLSLILLVVGFFMLFIEKYKPLGLKIINYSVIALIIGFGTCVATISI
jgi:hypothetical protein